MEVLASALFAAFFSLPCLLLLLAALALALRGEGCTRAALLGYRIACAGHPSSSSGGGVFEQEELVPPECLAQLAVAEYRRGGKGAPALDCVFCLSRIEEGEQVRELRCLHVFHRGCLDDWLLRPRATCPLCRDRLLPAADPPRACACAADDDLYGCTPTTTTSPPPPPRQRQRPTTPAPRYGTCNDQPPAIHPPLLRSIDCSNFATEIDATFLLSSSLHFTSPHLV